jgi:hypothetical protein
MADVAVRGAELFSVKLSKASQHNFILSEERFDLSRPCDQILEFASVGPSPRCASATKVIRPRKSTVATQPQLQPALLRLSAMVSQYFTGVLILPLLPSTRQGQSHMNGGRNAAGDVHDGSCVSLHLATAGIITTRRPLHFPRSRDALGCTNQPKSI